MKADELKTKTVDELKKLLLDLKKEQFTLRMQKAQGQLDNSAKVRAVRRDVARVQTFLSQKANGAETAAPVKKAAKAKKPAKATAA
ncbi:MAG: 50S ribosomal protein L29 [Micavibrio sp.]